MFDFCSFFLFKYWIKYKSTHRNLYIFDLDNTLINTYPLLNLMNLKDAFKNADLHIGMLNLFLHLQKNNENVIILTSRNIKYFLITKSYIEKKISKKSPFFIVSDPSQKIKFIKYVLNKFNKITYFDDLSYNHENGEVKFYIEIISEINNLPIIYFGYDEILKINNV